MVTNRWLFSSVLALTLIAAWPHWQWMLRRMTDSSDDPWGIIALATIVMLLWANKEHARLPNPFNLGIVAILMLLATAAWGVLPPMLAAACAMLSVTTLVASTLPKNRPLMPLLALSILALPLVASLNFYLGYPLRWVCAQGAALGLSMLGLDVTPQGAALLWNGKSILIDAPCAGISMLWIGLYLAALFSYLHSASTVRTCTNLFTASVIVILGNMLRNTLLFYKESGMVHLPHWTHEGIGILVLLLVVPSIYLSASYRHAQGDKK